MIILKIIWRNCYELKGMCVNHEWWLTSYFCRFSFSLKSNLSASSSISHCHSSLAFSLNAKQIEKEPFSTPDPWDHLHRGLRVGTHFSFSSFRWSIFRAFLRSARIFFFFSLSVSFLAPLLLSLCRQTRAHEAQKHILIPVILTPKSDVFRLSSMWG